MADLQRDRRSSNQIIIPGEFLDQRQEFNLICRQNILEHDCFRNGGHAGENIP